MFQNINPAGKLRHNRYSRDRSQPYLIYSNIRQTVMLQNEESQQSSTTSRTDSVLLFQPQNIVFHNIPTPLTLPPYTYVLYMVHTRHSPNSLPIKFCELKISMNGIKHFNRSLINCKTIKDVL